MRIVFSSLAAIVLTTGMLAPAEEEKLRTRISEEWGSKKTAAPRTETKARTARIAVMPAIYSSDVRDKFLQGLGAEIGAENQGELLNPDYTTYLIDALVNLDRYHVLERNDLISAVKELDFGESDYADDKKVARLGSMLNADYVVLPTIRYLAIEKTAKEVPYVNKTQRKASAKVATAVRTVDVRTGRIASSNIHEEEATLRQTNEQPLSIIQLKDLLGSTYRKSATVDVENIAKKIGSYPPNAPAN